MPLNASPLVSLRPARRPLAALLLALPVLASAQSFCASDGQRVPGAIVERFISADCEACWATAGARPAPNAMLIDWIVPGSRGDEAPLSAAATRESLDRLTALRQSAPGPDKASIASTAVRRIGGTSRLRVAHGLPLAGYLGASIELKPVPARGGAAPWTAWLVLVEQIAAGSDGTPVARNLVRNVLVQEWNPADAAPAAETPPGTRAVPRLFESRPMGIPEGARVERLRVLGWVQDAEGRVFAAAQSKCTVPKE